MGVGGGEIEGVIEIYIFRTGGKSAAQHPTQAGAADDRTGQRTCLQRAYPVGRQPFTINAEGSDKPSRDHGHKAISNVINLSIAQTVAEGADVVTLGIL